jgi:HSP20 family protein
MIEKLSELTAAGEELSKSGDLTDSDDRIHGVYGVNVHMGRDEFGHPAVMVEPFGNISHDIFFAPLSADVREPLVRTGETDRSWLVAMETPGVGKESVHVEAGGGRFCFSAKSGKITYRKEIDLPENCNPDRMTWDCQNGIVKVEFEKA